MVLKPIRNGAGVCAGIYLEAIRNRITIENPVQFAGIHAKPVLIANIDSDSAILLQISNVLIDKS